MKMKVLLILLLGLMAFPAVGVLESTESLYSVMDSAGNALFTLSGELHEGDEYIAKDNTLYRITSVEQNQAKAEAVGQEPMPDVSWLDTGAAQPVFADVSIPASSKNTADKKLIAMYVTHSDESYIPTDGTESINGQGGIYDVARKFRNELQALGVDVILDESTHLPHDSGAYRRSRQTAERLLQKRPDAIIDIHRDGIPDQSEYTCTINGENASQVRLLVGRSNQNSEVNREFAKQIKAIADKQYPGLIKDIFIGKGNYNQDLSPNAILLEFGTHTLSKERAIESTQLMADVVSTTLYGPQTSSAKSEKTEADQPAARAKENKGAGKGILLLLGAVIIGVLLFAFIQTGSKSGMKTKVTRGLSEMTGGFLGKKPDQKK